MWQVKQTTSSDPDFLTLVRLLDEELAVRDGADHAFYSQFNKVSHLQHVVVFYDEGEPVGCGAFKKFDEHTAEIKRMFVRPEERGRGVAGQILAELEKWAASLQLTRCVLETGKRQPEAIALYLKCGYSAIPNFGPYENVDNSVCFQKIIGRGTEYLN